MVLKTKAIVKEVISFQHIYVGFRTTEHLLNMFIIITIIFYNAEMSLKHEN